MREFIGAAINEMFVEDESGGVSGVAEIVVLVSQPVYGVKDGSSSVERQIIDERFSMTTHAMRRHAVALVEWADDLDAKAKRLSFQPAPCGGDEE